MITEGVELVLEHIFPQQIINHFMIRKVEKTEKQITISLEEKNEPPQGNVESKGFLPVSVMQDFPMRGIPVQFLLKRRRWRCKTTHQEVKRDYSLMAKGTQLEQQFASFLKD